MAEEMDYERIGRMVYGMQRACGGAEGLQALQDDPRTPPARVAQAAALTAQYRELVEKIKADGACPAKADVDAMIAAAKALATARPA